MRLPPIPEPSLKDATSFRFAVLHLVVEVDRSEAHGWSWTIYRADSVGRSPHLSPDWHKTPGAALRSAWAYLRKESKKT